MYARFDHVFRRYLSGERAQTLTAAITQYYRSPGSSGYHAATQLVGQAMRDAGADAVTEERYPLDGTTKFLGRTMPPAWEPVSAELALVGPTAAPIVRYPDVPSTLPWWSGPTPPEGVVVALVDVGRGLSEADYRGKPVPGNAVLIRDSESRPAWARAAALAAQHGAAGIVTDFLHSQVSPWRTRESLPDAVQLLRLAPGWRNPWAFAVDFHAAEALAGLARRGEARLHARVETRTFAGEGVNLTATIRGTTRPEETVLFIAHTSAGTKPCANCAAGPALMVELCRALKAAVSEGALPRPSRSITFLSVAEGLGSAYFLSTRRERLSNIKAAICLDSVGHRQETLKSCLLAYRVPDSTPSYVNDLSAALIDELAGDTEWAFRRGPSIPLVNFRPMPYTPWSDNHYWGATGVPTMLVMSWPDRYFHTQLLTADHTDPVVFHHCGRVLAALAVGIAGADAPEVAPILYEVAVRSAARLGRVTRRLLEETSADQAAAHRAVSEIDYILGRDSAALRSTLDLVAEDHRAEVGAFIEQLDADLRSRAAAETARLRSVVPNGGAAADEAAPEADLKRVPVRAPDSLCAGVAGLTYDEMFQLVEALVRDDERVNWETLRLLGDELWNFADGRRTIADIAQAIGFEFGLRISGGNLLTLARGLERAGALTLEPGLVR